MMEDYVFDVRLTVQAASRQVAMRRLVRGLHVARAHFPRIEIGRAIGSESGQFIPEAYKPKTGPDVDKIGEITFT